MIMFMKGFEWDLLHEFQWRKARVTAGRNYAASAVIETLKQRGPEMQSLAVHRGMVHHYVALGHHFFQIA